MYGAPRVAGSAPPDFTASAVKSGIPNIDRLLTRLCPCPLRVWRSPRTPPGTPHGWIGRGNPICIYEHAFVA